MDFNQFYHDGGILKAALRFESFDLEKLILSHDFFVRQYRTEKERFDNVIRDYTNLTREDRQLESNIWNHNSTLYLQYAAVIRVCIMKRVREMYNLPALSG